MRPTPPWLRQRVPERQHARRQSWHFPPPENRSDTRAPPRSPPAPTRVPKTTSEVVLCTNAAKRPQRSFQVHPHEDNEPDQVNEYPIARKRPEPARGHGFADGLCTGHDPQVCHDASNHMQGVDAGQRVVHRQEGTRRRHLSQTPLRMELEALDREEY